MSEKNTKLRKVSSTPDTKHTENQNNNMRNGKNGEILKDINYTSTTGDIEYTDNETLKPCKR